MDNTETTITETIWDVARRSIDGWFDENDGVALVKLGAMQDLQNVVEDHDKANGNG